MLFLRSKGAINFSLSCLPFIPVGWLANGLHVTWQQGEQAKITTYLCKVVAADTRMTQQESTAFLCSFLERIVPSLNIWQVKQDFS